MPNVIIEGPKIEDVNVKRLLVKDVTEIVEKAYKIPKEHIIVTIKEFSPENVGVGGILIADRNK